MRISTTTTRGKGFFTIQKPRPNSVSKKKTHSRVFFCSRPATSRLFRHVMLAQHHLNITPSCALSRSTSRTSGSSGPAASPFPRFSLVVAASLCPGCHTSTFARICRARESNNIYGRVESYQLCKVAGTTDGNKRGKKHFLHTAPGQTAQTTAKEKSTL